MALEIQYFDRRTKDEGDDLEPLPPDWLGAKMEMKTAPDPIRFPSAAACVCVVHASKRAIAKWYELAANHQGQLAVMFFSTAIADVQNERDRIYPNPNGVPPNTHLFGSSITNIADYSELALVCERIKDRIEERGWPTNHAQWEAIWGLARLGGEDQKQILYRLASKELAGKALTKAEQEFLHGHIRSRHLPDAKALWIWLVSTWPLLLRWEERRHHLFHNTFPDIGDNPSKYGENFSEECEPELGDVLSLAEIELCPDIQFQAMLSLTRNPGPHPPTSRPASSVIRSQDVAEAQSVVVQIKAAIATGQFDEVPRLRLQLQQDQLKKWTKRLLEALKSAP